MAKPQITRINPFNANKDYEITLSWFGNRAHGNRIIIYDNETNLIKFDDQISSFALKHTIPAGSLTNGKMWVIQAQVFDAEGIPSPLSDKVLFYTLETPDFYFDNIPENNKLDNASFTASLHYYSSDWEEISSYKFYLYDSTKKLLLESDAFSDDEDISYTYRGLDNNTDYYIRCIGVTANGMELDTGYELLSVYYENPNTYARIYATPVPERGCIQVATNLIIIQYNGTDEFDYEDGMIHLCDGKVLYYDEGFLIKDDFTLILRGMHLWKTADLLRMKNKEMGLCLSSHIYNRDQQLRFKLTVPNGAASYLIYSEPLVFTDEDMITLVIRRKNNIYNLEVYIELNYSTEGNWWYGYSRPRKATDYDYWIETDEKTYMVDKNIMNTFLENEEPIENIKLNDLWIGGD